MKNKIKSFLMKHFVHNYTLLIKNAECRNREQQKIGLNTKHKKDTEKYVCFDLKNQKHFRSNRKNNSFILRRERKIKSAIEWK